VGFSKNLRSVMDQFTESDSQRAAKRARTVKIKQESEMLSD
jgi:hypothetical protein